MEGNKMKKHIFFTLLFIAFSIIGCSSNFDRLKKQADSGDVEKQYKLAEEFFYGSENVEKNLANAEFYYRKSADSGYVKAKYRLGKLYLKTRDLKSAFKYIEEAAKSGHMFAQHDLGTLYVGGTGVEVDLKKAEVWFKKAYDKGDMLAALQLGSLKRTQNDGEKAKKYFLELLYSDFNRIDEKYKKVAAFQLAETERELKNSEEAYAWYCVALTAGLFSMNDKSFIEQNSRYEKIKSQLGRRKLKKTFNLALKYHYETFVKFRSFFKGNKKYQVYKNTYFLNMDNLLGIIGYAKFKYKKELQAINYFENKYDKNSRINYGFYNYKFGSNLVRYGSVRTFYYISMSYLEKSAEVFKIDYDKKNLGFLKEIIDAQIVAFKGMNDVQEEIWKEHRRKSKHFTEVTIL